jgi:SPOR domain
VAGIDARAAHAFDAEVIDARAPGHPWCVTRQGSGVPAACKYENFLTCGMAAIIAGASCKRRLSLPVTAGAVPLPRSRKLSVAKAPLQTRASAPVSRNDGLFRKFVRWSGGAPPSEAQSTTIVVSAEPETVFTASKPGPSEVEPARLEPAAVEPSTQQAHSPRPWLIQIGAYEGEADAKQHLSEAQLKASTALTAAAPFTESVQVGDKVLYRARFAGFDKGAAESACKHSSAVTSNA